MNLTPAITAFAQSMQKTVTKSRNFRNKPQNRYLSGLFHPAFIFEIL